MPIPKIIYQTWKTHHLPPPIEGLRQYMKTMNPTYKFHMFDDQDIENFISTYSEDLDDNDDLLAAYRSLAIGAARADFWRYLVLYKHGGGYLDMDAAIIQPIDDLLAKHGDARGIITREYNQGVFNNWIMFFEPRHPLLQRMIDQMFYNVRHRTTNDVLALTGPAAFTAVLQQFTAEAANLYELTDEEFAATFAFCGLRVYKKDMGEFARCKHRFAQHLYTAEMPHWRDHVAANGGSPFS